MGNLCIFLWIYCEPKTSLKKLKSLKIKIWANNSFLKMPWIFLSSILNFFFLLEGKDFVEILWKAELLWKIILNFKNIKLLCFPKLHGKKKEMLWKTFQALRILQWCKSCLTPIMGNSTWLIFYCFSLNYGFPPSNIKRGRQRSNTLLINWCSFYLIWMTKME